MRLDHTHPLYQFARATTTKHRTGSDLNNRNRSGDRKSVSSSLWGVTGSLTSFGLWMPHPGPLLTRCSHCAHVRVATCPFLIKTPVMLD